MYNYAFKKYGDALNSPRFFETTEVKNSDGVTILEKGKVVDSNFTIPNPNTPTATLNPVIGISNFEYETRLNDKKRGLSTSSEYYVVNTNKSITIWILTEYLIVKTNESFFSWILTYVIILLRVSQSRIMHHPRLCLPLR